MTTVSTQTADVKIAGATTTAMRVIFPESRDIDALPTYVDGGKLGSTADVRPENVIDRHSVMVPKRRWVSLGSYFNAFPAAYWARWTNVTSVMLSVRTQGPGTVVVYRSNARGVATQVDHRRVHGTDVSTFVLSLDRFGDGGYYWFDLVAGEDHLVMQSAQWDVPEADRTGTGRPSIGITTMNRPDYCINTLTALALDEAVTGLVDQIFVIDQGTQLVRKHPQFAEVAARLHPKLEVIQQENLGGSGGFARSMYETTTRGTSDYVLLMDDDIVLETESVSRMVTFANFTRSRSIVGGHMFDIHNRSVLQTLGERIDPFTWHIDQATPDQEFRHNFSKSGFRESKWIHQCVDAEYNAWWLCLIPVSLIKEIGLPAPLFIKWDDIEYGLRARKVGTPTVSLPGAAVWHMAWGEKDDALGWSSYFQARNRLLTAALYSPFEPPLRCIRNSFALDVKHNLAMQYFTSLARMQGLRDFLAGPQALHPTLGSRINELRAESRHWPDMQLSQRRDAFPNVKREKPLKPPRDPYKGNNPNLMVSRLVGRAFRLAVKQTLTPEKSATNLNPESTLSHKDNVWFNVARFDSAVVTNADGSGFWWYRRNANRARKNLAELSRIYGQITMRWSELRNQYRQQLTQVTSFEQWEKSFGIVRIDKPHRPNPPTHVPQQRS